MATIPTYFRLYLIIWVLQDYNFGVYTHDLMNMLVTIISSDIISINSKWLQLELAGIMN